MLGISAIIRSYSKLKYQQFRSNTEAANINDFGCSDIRCEMIVGYARVSTDGQTLDSQQAALVAAGCEKVFSEKVSGAKTDRAQLAKAIAALADGDTLRH